MMDQSKEQFKDYSDEERELKYDNQYKSYDSGWTPKVLAEMIAAENITEPLVAFNTEEEEEWERLEGAINANWGKRQKELAEIERKQMENQLEKYDDHIDQTDTVSYDDDHQSVQSKFKIAQSRKRKFRAKSAELVFHPKIKLD